MKRLIIILAGVLCIAVLSGCVSRVEETKKLGNIKYTILNKNTIPKEMMNKIETVKYQPFRMTYRDGNNLYIAQGYGAQLTTGYSIAVVEVYETEDSIHFTSLLKGPEKKEKIKKMSTFPYVVIKIKNISKKVVFE